MAELIQLGASGAGGPTATACDSPAEVRRVQAKAPIGEPPYDIWGAPRPTSTPAERLLTELEALATGGDLGNRYSDPYGQFRETYGATCLVGALLELWGSDTPDSATVEAAGAVRRGGPPLPYEPRLLPRSRFERREVVKLALDGEHCDVSAIETRTWLTRHGDMQPALQLAEADTERLDSGLLEGSGVKSRVVTQHVSRVVHNDPAHWSGLRYRTRLGGEHENWATYERSGPVELIRIDLVETDPAVLTALDMLDLKLESP